VLGVPWPGNLHDLTGWRDLLIAERHRLGIPYSPGFRRSLNARVNRIHANWSPDLRYHTNRPYQGEVETIFESVDWFFNHFLVL
jgi:hypothetical protein